jgi:enoyl-CoA hydratase
LIWLQRYFAFGTEEGVMQLERIESIALIRMRAGKANAMSDAWLSRMSALLDEADAMRPSALVVTGDGRSFCAGLDLPSLVDLTPSHVEAFMEKFSAFMLRVFGMPIPVVAAIDGHAIAGGCVLALQADARIMAQGAAKIGLNEARIGLGLPAVVVETLRCQLPAESLRPIALEGNLFSPEEAQRLGLVDEVVPPERLVERALERARELGAIPAAGFRAVKQSLRSPAVQAVRAAGDRDRAAWVSLFASAETQQILRGVVERLRKK